MAYVSFEREHVTLEADGSLSRQEAMPYVVVIDPDDEDPSNPQPRVSEGPHADLTHACDGQADKVCYKVGVVVTYRGQDYGMVVEDSVDAAVLPYTIPVPVFTGEWTVGQDGDDNGLPSHVSFERVYIVITADASLDSMPAPEYVQVVDPDDEDPTWPLPQMTAGPFTTIERVDGDAIYYKLGLEVILKGTPYSLVVEDTVDAGLLPLSLVVPTGAAPIVGPDADGDGIPAYYDVPMKRITIHDDEDLTREETPAEPHRLEADPDDEDWTNPLPQVTDGPHLLVVPDCGGMDVVCYKVGAIITWHSQPHGTILEGTLDMALLPYTLPNPVPTGGVPTMGPDADGDGFPDYVDIPRHNVTIQKDGTVTTSAAPPLRVGVDPDLTALTARAPCGTPGTFQASAPEDVLTSSEAPRILGSHMAGLSATIPSRNPSASWMPSCPLCGGARARCGTARTPTSSAGPSTLAREIPGPLPISFAMTLRLIPSRPWTRSSRKGRISRQLSGTPKP